MKFINVNYSFVLLLKYNTIVKYISSTLFIQKPGYINTSRDANLILIQIYTTEDGYQL